MGKISVTPETELMYTDSLVKHDAPEKYDRSEEIVRDRTTGKDEIKSEDISPKDRRQKLTKTEGIASEEVNLKAVKDKHTKEIKTGQEENERKASEAVVTAPKAKELALKQYTPERKQKLDKGEDITIEPTQPTLVSIKDKTDNVSLIKVTKTKPEQIERKISVTPETELMYTDSLVKHDAPEKYDRSEEIVRDRTTGKDEIKSEDISPKDRRQKLTKTEGIASEEVNLKA